LTSGLGAGDRLARRPRKRESLPPARRPRSSRLAVGVLATKEMGSSQPRPPLPSAITTTQCQHPPGGRHLHRHHRRRRRRRRSSSNSGNHSNSQSRPQRELPATASRDLPGVRTGGRARARAASRAPGTPSVPHCHPAMGPGRALPPGRPRPPALGSLTRKAAVVGAGGGDPVQRAELGMPSGMCRSPKSSLTQTKTRLEAKIYHACDCHFV
jgi:hypothetical protein